MKYLICSDIHGSYEYLNKIIDIFNKNNFDKLIILGDILYHGPRNDLPCGYEPKKVVEVLNHYKDKIIAIKGNCDAEVDEMVLNFPLHNHKTITLNNKKCYLVHGQHLFFDVNKDKLKNIDIVFYGHYHVYKIENIHNVLYINPGSISLPKEKNNHSYIVFDNNQIEIRDLMTDQILENIKF